MGMKFSEYVHNLWASNGMSGLIQACSGVNAQHSTTPTHYFKATVKINRIR